VKISVQPLAAAKFHWDTWNPENFTNVGYIYPEYVERKLNVIDNKTANIKIKYCSLSTVLTATGLVNCE